MFETKVIEKIETYVLCLQLFCENCTVYETMWENMVDPDRPYDYNLARVLHAG